MDDRDASVDIGAALAQAQARVVDWIEGMVRALPNFLAAILVLLAFWLVARLARRVVHRITRRVSDHPAVADLIATIAYLAVLALGTFLALGVLQLDKTVTSLLAGAGILGLALGFAFQSTAENFVARDHGLPPAVPDRRHHRDRRPQGRRRDARDARNRAAHL